MRELGKFIVIIGVVAALVGLVMWSGFAPKWLGRIARRHSDRARTFLILFSHRHLHHSQHRVELNLLALLDVSALILHNGHNGSQRSRSKILSVFLVPLCVLRVRFCLKEAKQIELTRHIARLLKCRRCPGMQSTPVSGGAIVSDVMVVGQAPGPREPTLKRPFAHTAGRTLFRWFEQFCGMDESAVRSKIYFAAVWPLFPRQKFGRHRPRPCAG